MAKLAQLNIADLMPDLPDAVRTLRAAADHYYALANEFEELANRQVRIESDPKFAQRIQGAEDQVVGDELLMEAQTPHKPRVVPHRGSGVNIPPKTPPPKTDMRI